VTGMAFTMRRRQRHALREPQSLQAALVAELSADTRRVFTLRMLYDLDVPEIATRLGLTPAQVEQHLVTAALAVAHCVEAASHIDSSDSEWPIPSSTAERGPSS
jgi:DNA-directed RNA polymerase specialized sigma24 family protein